MIMIDKLKGWLIGAALFVLAIAAAFIKGRKEGAEWEAARSQQAKEKAAKEARSVENEVSGIADADLDGHLNKWVRDNERR
jgi:hypothetical protein